MKDWIISKMINYLSQRGYIAYPNLVDSLDNWVDSKIHRSGLEAWALLEDGAFLYSGNRKRFLLFDSKSEALRWAENNTTSATHVRKVWIYK